MRQRENLLDVIGVVLKKRRLVVLITIVAALLSIIIALVLPVYYRSSTTFLAASPDQSNPTVIYNSQEVKMYGTGNDIERLLGIATSDELFNHLIDSFNLYQVYEIERDDAKSRTQVREQLGKLFEATRTRYDAIEIAVEDQDAARAASMANAARIKIERLLKNVNSSNLEKLANTYRATIERKTEVLNESNGKLEQSREKYNILDVETQAEALSGLLGNTDRKLVADSMLLASYRKSRVRGYRDSIAVIGARLGAAKEARSELKRQLSKFSKGSGVVSAYQEETDYLSKQLTYDRERLRQIESVLFGDNTVLFLLDEAKVPDSKSRPVRWLIVVSITFLAFVFTILGIIAFDTYNNFDWKPYLKD